MGVDIFLTEKDKRNKWLGKNPIATKSVPNYLLLYLFEVYLNFVVADTLFHHLCNLFIVWQTQNNDSKCNGDSSGIVVGQAKETRTKGDVFPKRSFKFSNKFNKRGSSPQNSSAQISTARHFFKKCQLLNRKIVINQIRLIPFFCSSFFLKCTAYCPQKGSFLRHKSKNFP